MINVSDFYGGLGYEISIEVSKDKLREYGLSFQQVASAVRGFSRNMSAGQIRAENGYINLRVENQAYRGHEFENLPVITRADGTKILLGDVATVVDGFQEGIQYSKFNGKNAVSFFIGAAENQSITDVASVINRFIETKKAELPDGVMIDPWVDLTFYLEGRLDMMLENMLGGAVLVFMMLALFLRIKLAFWVMIGLPVCFLGTLMLMPMEFTNVTINLVSLFAFIMVLGIVVDDAIVMGESAHAETEAKGHSVDNVIRGVKRVAMPATFGVLTTIAVFVPFILGDGPESAFGKSIGYVVILCLLFSLVESKLILPAHLAGMKEKPADSNSLSDRMRRKVDGGVQFLIYKVYHPSLKVFLKHRWAVLSFFIAVIFITVGLFQGGLVRYVGNGKIPHDFPRITIEMNVDTAEKDALATLLRVENIVNDVEQKIVDEYGKPMVEDMHVQMNGRTQGRIMMKLVQPDDRPIDPFELSDRWRTAIPSLPGVKSVRVQDTIDGGGREDGDISFRLESTNDEQLVAAATALKAKLNSIKGVGDVADSRQTSAKEVQFTLKPLAYSLGLSLSDIASQVAYSFYGLEAQRILRDSEEIRVMVRYPQAQRSSVGHVEDTLIQAPNGAELPLSQLADITMKQGVTRIRRENGNRTINIWGSVDAEQVEPFKVANDIRDNYIPELLRQFPTVKTNVSGRIEEEMRSANEQLKNLVISLMVIFSLLAIPLRSYSQPMMIMTVIPFGIVGAVYGHIIMGMDMSMMSVFGIMAVVGVVVNDSLVMVDYVNNARREGIRLVDAVEYAGTKRFRAIMLTSLTTFIGLVPIMFFETSLQAQLVIPMAVSLGFGVLFATAVTLILIPSLYLIFDDIRHMNTRTWYHTGKGFKWYGGLISKPFQRKSHE